MHPRLWFVAAVAAALPATVWAQPKNPLEDTFRASRLESPPDNVGQKFTALFRGTESLDPPTDEQRRVLETKARLTVYPVTHFDQYTSTETGKAELAPRVEEKSVNRLITELREQLVVVTPGDTTVPATKVQFCKEYGAAVVKAVDEVLAKATLPIVRANAVRMLAVLAESGAPAALEKITALLTQKSPQVEVLYWALKGAEPAFNLYDPVRGWVDRNSYHALVRRVDEIVREVPAVVVEQTYQPVGGAAALVADPKVPPKPSLSPEQVLTVQAFRLQAVRALARVRTDVVADKKGEGGVRTLYTLARVATSDPTLAPAPGVREVGEAVMGLANALPGAEVDVNVLAAAVARGVLTFAADKVSSTAGVGDEGKSPSAHWRLYGSRMKSAFQEWDKSVQTKAKLPKADRDVIADVVARAVPGVLDPLSKTDDRGLSPGLKANDLSDYLTKKVGSLKADQPLFRDAPATKLSLK